MSTHISDEEIERRMGYHRATFPRGFNTADDKLADWLDAPTVDGVIATAPRHFQARQLYMALAREVRSLVPAEEARYLALALTALEESLHWANAGIAMRAPLVDES
jgi:hypothetical protein